MQIKTFNLSKGYKLNKKETLVLKDINLDIKNKSIIGIIGSNGSGKTTLTKLLSGLLELSYGKIKFNNHIVTGEKKDFIKLRKLIGYSFQNPDIQFLKFNIFDEIELKLKILEEKNTKQKTEKILNELNLNYVKNKSPFKISQGQKRKVNFASSIIGNTKILFLDEPTANLDSISRKEVIDSIKKIKNKLEVIFIVSHDMDLIYEITDKTLLLNEGSLITFDKTEKILKNEKLLLKYKMQLPKVIKFAREINIETKAKNIKQLAKEINGN